MLRPVSATKPARPRGLGEAFVVGQYHVDIEQNCGGEMNGVETPEHIRLDTTSQAHNIRRD
jgi:hypothetical protein